MTKVAINKFRIPEEFSEKIKEVGLNFEASSGRYIVSFESSKAKDVLISILDRVYTETIGDGATYIYFKTKIEAAFRDSIRKVKLYCYSKNDFEYVMQANGWYDDVPYNCAVISIGNFSDNERHWFEDDYISGDNYNVFNLNIDDCEPFWYKDKLDDVLDTAYNDFIVGKDRFDKNLLKKSSMYFDYVREDRNGNFVPIHTMDYEEAFNLVTFIDGRIKDNKDFYIHCNAGVSRSQAIVRYILDVYPDINWETRKDNPCDTPNMHIVRMLKRIARYMKII